MTTIIRIEEQPTTDQPYSAYVSFNHGVRYPCQVRDPFADQPQQEADLEWYFEEYLTLPSPSPIPCEHATRQRASVITVCPSSRKPSLTHERYCTIDK